MTDVIDNRWMMI